MNSNASCKVRTSNTTPQRSRLYKTMSEKENRRALHLKPYLLAGQKNRALQTLPSATRREALSGGSSQFRARASRFVAATQRKHAIKKVWKEVHEVHRNRHSPTVGERRETSRAKAAVSRPARRVPCPSCGYEVTTRAKKTCEASPSSSRWQNRSFFARARAHAPLKRDRDRATGPPGPGHRNRATGTPPGADHRDRATGAGHRDRATAPGPGHQSLQLLEGV